MATQILNQFSQFQLTEAEQAAGEMLTVTQVQVLRNLLAAEAIKRLSITFNPAEPLIFAQQEAEITGAIQMLTYIIEVSEIAHNKVVTEALEDSDGPDVVLGPDAQIFA